MPSFIQEKRKQDVIAAIDLGSNALRAIIVRKIRDEIEVIKSIREPLRLGEDVFKTGSISPSKMEQALNTFIELLHLFSEYNVTQVRAMATSAMRDAKNGAELVEKVWKYTGIEIETINGLDEARVIFEAVKGQVHFGKKTALLMDIGGGSTELTIVKDGLIRATHSFDFGTVRTLGYQDQKQLLETVEIQVQMMMVFIYEHLGKKKPDIFIGTGGNLRRIGKIRRKILGKPSEMALMKEINDMEQILFGMSFVERIRRLELDQNRADVILPAIMLTQQLMRALNVNSISLPKVGLKEGIILTMLPYPPKKFIVKD